jgi:hypothetical protein
MEPVREVDLEEAQSLQSHVSTTDAAEEDLEASLAAIRDPGVSTIGKGRLKAVTGGLAERGYSGVTEVLRS